MAVIGDTKNGYNFGQLALSILDKFNAWKKGEIVSSELSHFIHKFHDGASRELYNIYDFLQEDDFVARAIVLKFLTEDEVPNNVLEQIMPRIDIYKQRLQAD